MSYRHSARLPQPLTDHTEEQGKIKQSIVFLLSHAQILIQDTGKRRGCPPSTLRWGAAAKGWGGTQQHGWWKLCI